MSERKKSKNAIKVTNNTIIDTLILGAGPIGLYCGQSCLKNNIKFLIFEKKENIGGQISALYPLKNVYDYPFKKNVIAQEIIEELKKGIENSILLNVQIINIVKKQNLFHVKYFFNNNDYKNKKEQNVICKNVINCTGIGEISFRKIDFPIDNINNVLYSVNDPQIFKDKKVIVLGGGDSASD
jgi:thioredoxin reductase (NADPH)